MLCTWLLYATMTLCMACACMVRMLAKLLQKTRAQYSDFHLSWTLQHKCLSLRGTSWAVVLWLKIGSPDIMMPYSNSYCAIFLNDYDKFEHCIKCACCRAFQSRSQNLHSYSGTYSNISCNMFNRGAVWSLGYFRSVLCEMYVKLTVTHFHVQKEWPIGFVMDKGSVLIGQCLGRV